MKKILKKALKGVMWVGVIGILLFGSMEIASEVFYADSDIINNWRAFYAQEKNSIDYLIVGNSHAYASFDTEMIERETGKSAFILASPSQTVTQAYFNVKESLKYQKPEMIILETFSIDNNSNWQSEDEETYDRHWRWMKKIFMCC